MTTETQPQELPPVSIEERMARMEAQQEIIIDLLRSHDARFDQINARIDQINARIDLMNHRLFLALLALLTMTGAGAITYLVNLLA